MPPTNPNQPQSQPPQPTDPTGQPDPYAVAQPNLPPVAANEPASPQMVPVATRKSKKPFIIVGAILLALIGGGVAGALWWTSPQKVFDDAFLGSQFQNFSQGGVVRGALEVAPSSGPGATVEFNSKFRGLASNTSLAFKVNAGAMKVDISGGVASDTNKNIYFKVNDVRKTVESFAGGSKGTIDQYYGDLIDKIDGKWVQITQNDLKDMSQGSDTDMSCMMDAVNKLHTDKSYADDLAAIYNKNQYFTLKQSLGSEKVDGRDTNHYAVGVDEAKMKSFDEAMKNSKLTSELKKCVRDSSVYDEAESSADASKFTSEVWIDKWTHQPVKLLVKSDDKDLGVKITIYLTPNNNQYVETPPTETKFKDLKAEIEKVQSEMNEAMQSSSQPMTFDETTVLGTSIFR